MATEEVGSSLVQGTWCWWISNDPAKVLAQGTKYRAYVLLQYPIGKANKMLVDQVKKSRVLEARMRASKAFKELEDDIKNARTKK